jgi:hypothetical protein
MTERRNEELPLAPEAPPEEEEIALEEITDEIFRRLRALAEDLGGVSSELAALIFQLPEILEEQPAARQTVIVDVLAAAFDAFDYEQSDAGAFLIQIAIILTAGHEDNAAECLQKVAGGARAELTLPRN